MQLVENLLREPSERAAYLADPSGYLPAHGFGDFTNEDVELSLQLVADAFPPALAERLDPAAGLDTVVAVDIDDVPGLLSHTVDEPVELEDIAGDDDPFLDTDPDDGALDDGAPDDGALDDTASQDTAADSEAELHTDPLEGEIDATSDSPDSGNTALLDTAGAPDSADPGGELSLDTSLDASLDASLDDGLGDGFVDDGVAVDELDALSPENGLLSNGMDTDVNDLFE